MKVGLVVDNPKRDLTGMVLLANELIKLNHEVILIPMNLDYYEIPLHKPDYILLPKLRESQIEKVSKYYNMGINLGILETEGGFYLDPKHRYNILEKSHKVDNIISHYFSWGNAFKKILLKAGNISKSKILVYGHPKMDVIKSLTKRYVVKDSILFCSNFITTQGFKNKLGLINKLEEMGTTNAEEYYSGLVDMKREFIDLAKYYADLNQKVIFRPHPFEDIDFYKEILKHNLIEIDLKTNAIDSIDKSFSVIQNSSTTGVESILRGVPTIIPNYIKNGYKIKEIRNISYLANSKIELYELVDKAKNGRLDTFEYSESLEEILYMDSNHTSAELMARAISIITPRRKTKVKKINIRHPLKKQLKALLLVLVDYKRFRKYILEDRLAEWDKSYKAFSINDIEQELKFLQISDIIVFKHLEESRTIGLKGVLNES